MAGSHWTGLTAAALLLASAAHGQDAGMVPASADNPARLQALQAQLAEQAAQLEALRRLVEQQETRLNDMRRQIQAVPSTSASSSSAATATSPASAEPSNRVAGARPAAPAAATQPVGVAPPKDVPVAAVAVGTLFDQPGVLTGRGNAVIEPSLQYSYASSNRVALVGYTVIPSILVGVVDVREVKRSSLIGALTARFGVTNRLEVEGKLPWVYRSDTSIGRELLQGSATSTAFGASGQNIGDIEGTVRYQLNDGGQDSPYFVGSLRVKSRTGKDPFQVTTSKSVVGFTNEGLQTELPTGSGFYGVQPALTMLYPSDPAVFFGTLSYLQSIKRNNVVRKSDGGPEALGTIAPGGIIGFNFGMGLALNERSSFSIGYDHSVVGRTRQNGAVAADSVRLQLGTLLLGYSLKLNSTQSVNISLGTGVTRDTPDVTLSLRVPTTF